MEKENPELAPIIDEEIVCSECFHKFNSDEYGTTCPLCDKINIEEEID